jgi:hypothetical protein
LTPIFASSFYSTPLSDRIAASAGIRTGLLNADIIACYLASFQSLFREMISGMLCFDLHARHGKQRITLQPVALIVAGWTGRDEAAPWYANPPTRRSPFASLVSTLTPAKNA